MAQELAEMEGINVQTVIVRDDIAVTNEVDSVVLQEQCLFISLPVILLKKVIH